ncbi:MAG: hypothetical protein WAO91_00140 [Candidatus Nitrosotenuis sp.]
MSTFGLVNTTSAQETKTTEMQDIVYTAKFICDSINDHWKIF